MPDTQSQNYAEAIEFLKKQCRSRPIVPFLGAGVSLASGFPAIRSIVEYLAKVDFAIENEVYFHRYPRIQLGGKGVAEEYKEHPSRFLRDFGWPGLGQLDSDLWEWLERSHSPSKKPLELDLGHHSLWNRDAKQLAKSNVIIRNGKIVGVEIQNSTLDLLSHDICSKAHGFNGSEINEINNKDCLDLRDHLRAIVQWGLRRDLRLRESGTTQAVIQAWKTWKKWYRGQENGHEPELLYGDWESLLDRLCEGDFNLVDTLFTSLEGGRQPTTTHRFITFLHATIEIPIILTTNFESLLERAFHDAGRTPKVFDIHKDANLPDADLVRREFSILKLHGSSYGLRLGERLRTPIEYEAQADVIQYLPNSALILVIGFSGSERRIMQLLHAIATSTSSRHEVRILWLKGPGSLSVPLQQLLEECKAAIKICEISDAGAFLEDLYFAYSQGYRSSKVSYNALGGRPIIASADKLTSIDFRTCDANDRSLHRRPVQLLFRKIEADNSADDTLNSSASNTATLTAAEFCNYLGYRYHQIWIDLESHHTVSGVVDDLFNNFRRFDPGSPHVSIADSIDGSVGQEVLHKVVDRIGEVLGRGRYVIVFDSLESFGRTQMMHHGIPTYELLKEISPKTYESLTRDFQKRVSALREFLELLLFNPKSDHPDQTKYFRDSYVVLTADKERARQRTSSSTNSQTLETMKGVVDFFRHSHDLPQHIHRRFENPKTSRFSDLDSVWRDYDQTHSNVADRVASVAKLKITIANETLSSAIKNNNANVATREITNNELTALVTILSVFRRPRSMAMVRSLTERWILPEKGYLPVTTTVNNANVVVNEMLTRLAEKSHVIIHQGGRVRIDRQTHEELYSNLTKDLHVGTVILEWKKRNLKDCNKRARLIVEGMLVSSLHFAAARTMYVDVFLPTKDVHAFYEYLYHRVSVLRLLTVVHALLRMPGVESKDLTSSIYKIMRDSNEKSGIPKPPVDSLPIWFFNTIGMTGVKIPTFGSDTDKLVDDFSNYVQELRLHALQTLSLAVRRSAPLLRSVASPETLLSWARQFDQREKADISGTVFLDAFKKNSSIFGEIDISQLAKAVELNREASKALDETEQIFHQLAARSSFAKLDFLSVIETQLNIPDVSTLKFVDRAKEVKDRLVKEMNTDFFNSSISSEEAILTAKKWLMPIRAISHLGWYDVTRKLFEKIRSLIQDTLQGSSSEIAFESQVLKRDVTELELKTILGENFHPWHVLDDGWKFDITAAEAVTTAENDKGDIAIRCEALRQAEAMAVEYETLLRETSKTPSEDARHRSSAYLLRSRALYLQGQFRTAHRYLDLAACGTNDIADEKGVGQASIHLARAELLVCSADIHLTKFDNMVSYEAPSYVIDPTKGPLTKTEELDEIAKEWNKLKRAEEEVSIAKEMLSNSRHQTIWLFRTHVGIAQIVFERLLAGMENFAREEGVIGASSYARYSGQLEGAVLNGMRNLRNALDLLPFVSELWKDVNQPCVSLCPSIRDERRIYALWMHYYVVSKFFWSVLQMWHNSKRSYADVNAARLTTVEEIVTQVNGNRAKEGDDTWKMWCSSLRFRAFATLPLHTWLRVAIDEEASKGDGHSYSVAPIRRSILSICREISCSDNLDFMWDLRRRPKSSKSR